jgi:hypothetical protein
MAGCADSQFIESRAIPSKKSFLSDREAFFIVGRLWSKGIKRAAGK